MSSQSTSIVYDPNKLKVIPLFASLNRDQLRYVTGILKWPTEPYSPGTSIITEGSPNDKLFIIVDGEVKFIRHKVSLGTLKKYAFFGETGLLKNKLPNATIEAVTNTSCFYIEQEQFKEMLELLPPVKRQIKAAVNQRSKTLALQSFPGLDEDEVALWVTHHNVIPLLWESLPGLIVGNLAAAILAVLAFFSSSVLGERLPAMPWFLGALAVIAFTLVWAWYLVDWTNDYLVLTDQRIIRKEVFAFLRETRQEAPVEAVQEVTLNTKGPIYKLLDIADITIQTIGGKIAFDDVRHAEDLKNRILGRRDMIQLEAKGAETDRIREELMRALRQTP